MSERRVNVRLAAVGGDKLKADLVSIGREGKQALRLIEETGPAATAGLNMTGQAANDLMGRLESLAGRAARAAANMNEMATSGGNVLARVNASTGVSGGMTRDAADIAAYGSALDDMRAKFNPLFAEQLRHADMIQQIDHAAKVGAISLDEWVSATKREEAANAAAANSIRQRQAAFDNFVNTGLRDKVNEIVGVTGALARSEADIEAYGRALNDARAKFNPLFAEERRHAEALAEIDRAHKSGAISMAEWEAATKREIAANEQAAASVRSRLAAMDNMVNTGLRDKIDSVTGVSGDLARSAEDVAAYGRALDDARAKYNPMFAAIQKYRNGLAEVRQAHAAGAISADEMTAAISRLRQASLHDIGVIKGRVQGYQAMEKGAGMARFQMVQLGYQLNDIGVSLASGQNPLIVMVQQGAQIQQIYGNGNGGVSEMFRQIGGLITGLPGPVKAIGIAAGIAAIGIAGMTNEINKTSDITVTFGDTAKAVFQVIGRSIGEFIKPAIDAIAPWFSSAWELVKSGTKAVGNFIIKAFQVTVAGIDIAIATVPNMFKAGFYAAKAEVLKVLSDITYGIWNMLKSAADGFNSVFNTSLSAPIGLLKASTSMMSDSADAWGAVADARSGANFGEQFGQRKAAILASDPMGDFFGSVREQAIQNARDREDGEKKGGGGGSGGKAMKAEKDATDDLIKSLEQEMAVLRETDPIKKKMLEYSKDLATATEDQKRKVLELVTALDQEKHGFAAIGRTLKEYAEEAKRSGDDIGQALVGAFQSAENAFAKFVTTGKLSFRDLVTSLIEDMARLTARQYITGPLAGFLDNLFSGSGGGLFANIFHDGGMVGATAPGRMVPAAAFARAPRMHGGGWAGLRSDEVPAILQKGERVLSRREAAGYGRDQGGVVRVVATHDPGILVQIIDERVGPAVQGGLQAYDRDVLPHSVRAHIRDPRRVG